MKRTQTLKANHLSRNGVVIADCRQKQQDNQNKPQKHKEPNKSFYQYMKKKIKTYQTRIYTVIIALENHSQANQINQEINHHITPFKEVDRLNKKNSRNFSQNRYSRSNTQNNQNRNNYSRSNSNTTEFVSASSCHSNPRKRHYSNNRSRNSSYNRNRNYPNKRNRSYSNNRNQNIKIGYIDAQR